MIRRILIIPLLTSVLQMAAQPKVIDKVVAVVGDKPILMSDIEMEVLRMQQEGEVPDNIRCLILNELLTQKLLLNQAEVDSVEVKDEEVDDELDRRMRYFVSLLGSEEKLEEYYQKSIPEMKEEFRDDIKEQLMAQRMRNQITGDVVISPAEVKKYFRSIPSDSLPYFNAEVQVGQLVFLPKVSEQQRQEAIDKLRNIRERILNGEDFGLLAYLYSEDPGSARNNGELPEFGRNEGYAPEFVGAAFRLKEGEVSDIVETEFGYHIIQLLKRKGERVQVRHILIIPKLTTADYTRTRQLADSVRQLLVDGIIDFDNAVKKYSDDETTKNTLGMLVNQQTGDTWFEIDQLGTYDQELPFLIDTMKTGEFSKPVVYKDYRQKDGFRIIYLKNEKPPHKANLEDDYSRIQAAALNAKKDQVMKEWMQHRIRKTYVRIDPEYNSCKILKKWMQEPE